MIHAGRRRSFTQIHAITLCVAGAFLVGTLPLIWPIVSEIAALGASGDAVTLTPAQFEDLVTALRSLTLLLPAVGILLLIAAWALWKTVRQARDPAATAA